MKFTIAVILILVAVLVFLISMNNPVEVESVEKTIPTIIEVQEFLVEQGFTIKVDGILGKETQRAWYAYDTGLK
jgi:hypothetical protein